METQIKEIADAVRTDFMVTIQYDTGCRRIAISKEAISKDFIYECNHGRDIFFVFSENEAAENQAEFKPNCLMDEGEYDAGA